MEIEVDIREVRNFVEQKKFHEFLIDNTTDFSIAAFILQTLLDKIKEIETQSF